MSVLLDTSVWIRHFKASNADVVRLLEDELVVSHEFIIGELACGSLKSRNETISHLQELAGLPVLPVKEVMILVEAKELFSRGIGLIDAQLLASTLITPDTLIWSMDKRLNKIAAELGVSYTIS